MQIFAQITKVDDVKGLVYGRAVAEELDGGNEIFDYETSKPNFEAWSQKVAKATGGKSVGNVRAMHQLNAVGKLTEINFNDVEKAIDVCAEIVDPVEMDKCRKGVYTGFSIGGKYGGRWPDPVQKGAKRYTAKPTEISLVDMPCVGSAQFTVVKADGSEELRKFVNTVDSEESLAKWLGSLPTAQQQLLRKRLEQSEADRLAPYMPGAERIAKHGDNAQILAATLSAAIGQPVLAKGLYTVSRFAELLASLAYIVDDARYEASVEGDNSPVPAQLQATLKPLVAAFLAMAAEEAAEALHTDPGVMTMAAQDQIQKTEDADLKKTVETLTARLAVLEKAQSVAPTPEEQLTKAMSDNEILTKAVQAREELLTKAAERIDQLNGLVKKLSAEPEPIRAARVALTKGQDGASELGREVEPVLKADGTEDKALTELRKALAQPVRVR